jgi:hypothetical protein
LMQLAAWLLPSAPAAVDYSAGTPNSRVSNNMFSALANARVPANSFTMFQTGRADVVHATTPPRSAAETPVAQYWGFWMGMSQVRDVTTRNRTQIIPVGERISINDPIFRQGGLGTPFEDLVDLGVTMFDQIDDSVTAVDFQNIDDLFIQVGLDVSTQEAIRRMTSTETTAYKLVPHLSFSGNRTGGEQVFRYYTGVVLADETTAYVGADYTLSTESGWNAYARMDIYTKSIQDYVSEAELRASRTFTINPQRQFTIGAGAVAALDDFETMANGTGLGIGDNDMRADFVGRWREGPLDMTIRQRYSQATGSDDWQESTTFGVSYAASNTISLTAQITPYSTEDSYVEAALGVNMRLAEGANAPTLQAQYSRATYDVGTDGNGDRRSTTNDIFGAQIQFRF